MKRPPATPIQVLMKANDRGEVGYAHGGREEDYPAFVECLDKGWLRYGRDASVGGRFDILRRPYQKRTIYFLTAEGRKVLERQIGRPDGNGID